MTDEQINDHDEWVRNLARQLVSRLPANVELSDLEQAGRIALWRASQRFTGGNLRSFAYDAVKGAMLSELRDMDFLTRQERKEVRKIERGESDLPVEVRHELLRAEAHGRLQFAAHEDEHEPHEHHEAHELTPVEADVALRRSTQIAERFPEEDQIVMRGLLQGETVTGLGVTKVRVGKLLAALTVAVEAGNPPPPPPPVETPRFERFAGDIVVRGGWRLLK